MQQARGVARKNYRRQPLGDNFLALVHFRTGVARTLRTGEALPQINLTRSTAVGRRGHLPFRHLTFGSSEGAEGEGRCL